MSKKNKGMRSKKKKSASDIRSEKAYKITAHIKESATQTLLAVRAGLRYV